MGRGKREAAADPRAPRSGGTSRRHSGWLILVLSLAVTILASAPPGSVSAQGEVDLGELQSYIDELDAAIDAFDPERAKAEADELAREVAELEEAIEDDNGFLFDGGLTLIDETDLEDLVALARFLPLEDPEQRALLGLYLPELGEILERVELAPEWELPEATEAVRTALRQDVPLKKELAAATLERMKAELEMLHAGSKYLEELKTSALAIRTSERLRRSGKDSQFTGVFSHPWKNGGEMQLGQSGDRIIGEFDYNKGQVIFRIAEYNRLEGFWIEDGTGRNTCSRSKLANGYWGTLNITFNDDFSSYAGEWGYCDGSSEGGWSGKRLGAPDPDYPFASFEGLDIHDLDVALFGADAPADPTRDGRSRSDPTDTGRGDADDPTAPGNDAADPPDAGAPAIDRLAEAIQGQLSEIRDTGSGFIELGKDDIGALVPANPNGKVTGIKLRDDKIEIILRDDTWRAVFIYPKVDADTGELSVKLTAERKGLFGLVEVPFTRDLLKGRDDPKLLKAFDAAMATLPRIENEARAEGFRLKAIVITDEGMSVGVESVRSG